MTTIAYRDGVMAADSQMTNGNFKRFGCSKLFEIYGWSIGFAGHPDDIPILVDFLYECWLTVDDDQHIEALREADFPENIDTEILIAHEDMLFHVCQKGRVTDVSGDFMAIGSGADFALGAMGFGANARDAVETAKKFDIYTGGDVDVLGKAALLKVLKNTSVE